MREMGGLRGVQPKGVPIDDDSGVVRAMRIGEVGINEACACGVAHREAMRRWVEKLSYSIGTRFVRLCVAIA